MKLTATSDRWATLQDLEYDEEYRDFNRLQAAKHALDVYRVIAMITIEERDRANEVVESLVKADAFTTARRCWQNGFCGKSDSRCSGTWIKMPPRRYSRYPTGARQLVRLIRRVLTRTHLPIQK